MSPSLGLCMIVKNGASTIRWALESVRGFVDAMVVVDTGSTDGTPEIAAEFGARVLHFPWTGNFAEARNVALRAIETDWVLVLDADEEIDEAGLAWIRKELAAPLHDGYVVGVRNYMAPGEEQIAYAVSLGPQERNHRVPDAEIFAISAVCRLYRRDPEIFYGGHVHEQVEYEMVRRGQTLGAAGFLLHHYGWYFTDREGFIRKEAMYAGLLQQKLKDRPDDGRVLVQCGDALLKERPEESLVLFQKALVSQEPPVETHLRIACAMLQLRRYAEALEALELSNPAEQPGFRARLRSEACAALGRWAEAREACAETLKYFPTYIGVAARLGSLEMLAGDVAGGQQRLRSLAAEAMTLARQRMRAKEWMNAAEIHFLLEDWPAVLAVVNEACRHFPQETGIHDLRLKVGIATEEVSIAIESAAKLAELEPSQKTFLRLAAILDRAGHADAARLAYVRSQQLRMGAGPVKTEPPRHMVSSPAGVSYEEAGQGMAAF